MGETGDEAGTPTAAAAGKFWQESASKAFIDRGRIYTVGREEIKETFLDLLPAIADDAFIGVEIGIGQGWLTEAILSRFPAARMIGLDGSATMLREASTLLAPFGDRTELRPFRLEQRDWIVDLPPYVRCFVSSLVIHHLDGPAKRGLYAELFNRLEPGGALLIADIVEPTTEPARRHMARAWSDEVKRQSLALTGDLRAYEQFVADQWNVFDYPDPEMDKPSPLRDQLYWLDEAGFTGVDVFWARAGHAVFGGYKPEQ